VLDGMVITDEEFQAMSAVIRDYARLRGEDVIGAFMLTGGFHVLRDDQHLCDLAKRVDQAPPIIPKRRETGAVDCQCGKVELLREVRAVVDGVEHTRTKCQRT
jgi:hypothetical protein